MMKVARKLAGDESTGHGGMSRVLDPRNPDLHDWLRSLDARQELVMRHAIRESCPEFRNDGRFMSRYRALLRMAKPTATEKELLCKRAERVGRMIGAVLDHTGYAGNH